MKAAAGADLVVTDTWISMHDSQSAKERRHAQLRRYQVNDAVMAAAKPGALFMHCLPAFHNTETQVGKEIFEKFGMEALEVTEEVFESPANLAFEQAENRMHTIKAILVAALG